jgi:GAF domain-containing protein
MTALPIDVVVDLRQENARLQAELRAVRDRQAASAEILRAIASTGGDAARSLQQIAETTASLFGASSVSLLIADGERWGRTIRVGAGSERIAAAIPLAHVSITPQFMPGAVYLENRQVHVSDIDDPAAMARWPGLAPARAAGTRTMSGTPLRHEGQAIGALIVHRDRLEPFTAEELALQQSFADQAVIAIENARLFNETQEALARQTATSEILRVISGSPTDVQPVFDAIVLTAARLFRRDMAFMLACDTTTYWPVATAGPEGLLTIQNLAPVAIDTDANFPSRVILTRKNLHLPDWSAVELPEYERMVHETRGINSALYLPLLREGECIGLLGIAGKQAGVFGDSEIALAESFRDQALIAIENTRLFNETREALERQTATSDILKVIASSPSEVQPVFEAIVNSAAKLFEPCAATITTLKDGKLHWNATVALRPDFDVESAKAVYPIPFDPIGSPSSMAILERRIIEIPDTAAPGTPEFTLKAAAAGGFRSITFVPLVSQANGIGTIILTHPQAGFRLSEKQLALVQTFADQAVIAIENTRLFNETQEALERQTATAEILKVIASSPNDVQPVFDVIVERAVRLCGARMGRVYRYDDGMIHLVAGHNLSTPGLSTVRQVFPRPAADDTTAGRAIRSRQPYFVTDIETDQSVPLLSRQMIEALGTRSQVTVPILRTGEPIGAITVGWAEPAAYGDQQVALLQTFADQAVIAIENVRLFNETREALERQTATADILKVIASSPSDVQPVFDAIATSANRLIGGFSSTVFRFIDGVAHLKAFTPTNPAADEVLQATFPRPVADFPPFQMAQAGEVTQVPDTEAFSDDLLEISRARGYRSMLFAPLMNDGVSIGFIAVTRVQPGNFTEHHVQLLRTFADQAVIAIENARLFEEVQAKTRDLSESLQQQTATADVLKVISRSAFDLNAVLNTLIESGANLCEAPNGVIWLRRGDHLHLVAHVGYSQEWVETAGRMLISPDPNGINVTGRIAATGELIHVADISADERFNANILHRMAQYRAILGVPLIRDGRVEGVIGFTRTTPGLFNQRQVELVQTFADQAVIAIENARLFDEVQARTEDLRESLQFQTATSDVLKVISSSPDSLQPVLDVIVETSRQLCSTETSTIFLLKDDKFHIAAASGAQPEYMDFLRNNPIALDQAGSSTSRAARQKRTVHIPDIGADPEFGHGPMSVGQRRALLSVPLMREGSAIGVITMRQTHLTPFTERQIEVVQTFADQAVIAISNVRLFEQVQQRTRELSKSLDDLRTAQDRLVQTEKLASLGQLTAGIAHEIKNPLNFVNNFSALSSELTDELNDVLKQAPLTDKLREEVDELTGLLKDNLQKVVQHGKRADSIVKNMLLHSREGSGDHRPADINALVDESLNLAYHGARAEKSQFNVTLQRDFDPNAGMIEVFPQEITRVLLNLISNGFYAVTKRKAENGSGFEPSVIASTRDRGEHVEIRIRDNGTGIPPDVKEKMFNPFFTTKPAGEGTGLGLSMSYDIIVKQHGGTIDVATQPGQFTEFTIVLPRTSNLSNESRG